jgi:hypothetical protein
MGTEGFVVSAHPPLLWPPALVDLLHRGNFGKMLVKLV